MTHPLLAHRAVGAVPTARAAVDGADVGGPDAIRAVVERLYDGIEGDRTLRPKFGSDLDGERRKLGAFLVEVFGGPPEWNTQFAYHDLAGSHRFIHITDADAGRWLGHARRALADVAGEGVAARVVEALRPIAEALVNEAAPAERGALREERYRPTREGVTLCERGDSEALVRLLEEWPHLVAPGDPGSAELMYAAASRGRVPVLQVLIERGADVDKPGRVRHGGLMLTPLCAARAHRRHQAVALLRNTGAVDDVFTEAFLGRGDALRETIGADAALANEPDPASDFFRATVVDHAVHGASPDDTLTVLAGLGARSPAHGHLLLRHAADGGRPSVVRALLEIGAEAAFVTPGRWVLDRECAGLLRAAGADVNHAPTRWESWIWQSCTGNKGNKDDPAFVAALVDAGADVHARAFGKTALHFTAKAGFVGATSVLLAAGADPNTTDDTGLTPLWHLLRSGTRADRVAIARLLLDAGADPAATDEKGRRLADAVAADRKRPGAERSALVELLTPPATPHGPPQA
jgi:truncated hemoglobin YjbI/ankyrin repeat protein